MTDVEQHNQKALQNILNQIRAHGPLDFARFMQLALYAPGLGYYSAGNIKFGKDGDFVTAPEISPLFSYCLAEQAAQILPKISGGAILELGAGSGVMARDILLHLQTLNSLPQKYFILEVSADLRARQQEMLKNFSCVEWLNAWPKNFRGVVLANEVLDAMPVRRFCYDHELLECVVGEKDGELNWFFRKPSDELKNALRDFEFPSPYLSEINCSLPAWFKSLSESMQEGVALFIDYGFPRAEFYHPERNQGTLRCHFRHRSHDNPLINIGIQDITAHVDFTAVAEAADAAGFDILGYTSQALFLLSCGLEKLISSEADLLANYNTAQKIKTLTLPSEMGELVKVIAIGKNFDSELLGFDISNQLERL